METGLNHVGKLSSKPWLCERCPHSGLKSGLNVSREDRKHMFAIIFLKSSGYGLVSISLKGLVSI